MTTTRTSLQASTLLAAATDGDAAAWTGLVGLYADLVWVIATHPELTRAQAEETSRVTWLLLAQRLGQDPAEFPVGVWLARTAREQTQRRLAHAQWRGRVAADQVS